MERKETIVIKIGSSSITNNEVGLNTSVIKSIARQISVLYREGYRIALVSSGAVAAGRLVLQKDSSNGDLIDKQVAAIYGQPIMNGAWKDAFAKEGILAGQILLTGHDLENSRQPLLEALNHGIPIINANDPVNDEEMRQYLIAADNDRMAGHVAELAYPNKLIFLTDVEGVKDWNGEVITTISTFSDLRRIRLYKKEDEAGKSEKGTGGMRSKLKVGLAVSKSGCGIWIANANEEDIILKIVRGEQVGTKIYKP